MAKEVTQACTYDGIRKLLDSYGDFHDCFIMCLIQDFAKKRVEIHIDNIFSGLITGNTQPGAIILEQVEYIFCSIAYIGGEIRIEGLKLLEAEDEFILNFELTTTEWMNSMDEFR